MTKRIQPTETAAKPLRDTGSTLPRIDPAQVQEALGAEPAAEGLAEVLALDRVGVRVPSFGDSTGRLSGLEG